MPTAFSVVDSVYTMADARSWPEDVTRWEVYATGSCTEVCNSGKGGRVPIAIWKQYVLKLLGRGASAVGPPCLKKDVKAVWVYYIEPSGGAITAPFSEGNNPWRWFRVLGGRNDVATLRLYRTGVNHSFTAFPSDCQGIPMIPGLMIVIVIGSDRARSRNAFLTKPPEDPWLTI